MVRWPYARMAVAELSMLPVLAPGDWILVRRGGRIRPGDLVVFVHPARPELRVVKRAVRREGSGWWVEAANPAAGAVDSRQLGAIPDRLVEGRVVWRYRRRAEPGVD